MPGLYQLTTTGENAGTSKHCVTPAEAARQSLLPPMDAACHIARNVLAGGRVDAAFSCPGMSGTITGSYTATSYTMDTHALIKAGGQSLNSASHVVAQRIGATCSADAD